MESSTASPRCNQSSFLALPLEIRLIIYEAYFGKWSCTIGSTGLHRVACSSTPSQSLSISLISTCKQVYEEISAHRCFHRSFTGITSYTRGCCLSRLRDLKDCWVLTSTTHVKSYFLNESALRKGCFLRDFPSLETIEIGEIEQRSSYLGLHASTDEAATLFRTLKVDHRLVWSKDHLDILKEVVSRNDVNVAINTYLTLKDIQSFVPRSIVCSGIIDIF